MDISQNYDNLFGDHLMAESGEDERTHNSLEMFPETPMKETSSGVVDEKPALPMSESPSGVVHETPM